MCAVVLEVKDGRLRVLTEGNREATLSANRLVYVQKDRIAASSGRDDLLSELKRIVDRRRQLAAAVDIVELWEVLNSENEWIDLQTMTQICFPREASADHESAVLRAFFKDRLYFRFQADRFFPYPPETVAARMSQIREAERKERIVAEGGRWLKTILSTDAGSPPEITDEVREGIEILKSMYLFDRESPHHSLAKKMLAAAGIKSVEMVFPAMVRIGVWSEDENVDLHRFGIQAEFPPAVLRKAETIVRSTQTAAPLSTVSPERRDLTHLSAVTIDGQATRDFDDALSLDASQSHFLLGIHIVDVGSFVKRDDIVDREAAERASSIYMPDQKISMLPTSLAEGICSLKAGEERPAVSTLIKLSPSLEYVSAEIVASRVRIRHQYTYYDVNNRVQDDRKLLILHDIAKAFRRHRLGNGALQITLPEMNVWLESDGRIAVSQANRESPSRMLVAELMIMANWCMARYLKDRGMPAVFRSQAGPKERLFKGDQGSLFQNWMQRKLLSRFLLSPSPERHAGLGLDAYVTATSPIRKYFDLVTQRQVRAVLGRESAYSEDQINEIIQALEQPMAQVARVQSNRQRYWLLKHLQSRVGQKEEAIVLYKKRNGYQILLSNYMLECDLPVSAGISLKPEDCIRVTLQQVSARRNVLTVFMS